MIRLEVEDYCHPCLDFTPDTIKPEREISKTQAGTHSVTYSDTIIKCKYRNRCANIKRFLEHQRKNEEVDG